MVSDCVAAAVHSAGQYGHLKRAEREPRASFVTEASASTWPHGSSIGGLPSEASSREMGHVNVEWSANLKTSSAATSSDPATATQRPRNGHAAAVELCLRTNEGRAKVEVERQRRPRFAEVEVLALEHAREFG